MRAVVALALALALLAPGAARADGDPASDILFGADVFLTYSAHPGPASSALGAAVASAYARGFRLKVAVIASDADLGSVPSLFGQATAYARFLGTELNGIFVGPLLIVMPSGFGIYDGGRTTAAERRVLGKQRIDASSPDALVGSATAAVKALLSAGALRSRDILPPSVFVRPAAPQTDHSVLFTYAILEDSERVSHVVTIFGKGGAKRLARLAFPARPTIYPQAETARWKIPKPLPRGPFRYCVVATDPAGLANKPACLPFDLR